MTVIQLASGIFLGLAAHEVFKVGIAMYYEKKKRAAMVRDLQETADGFIEQMHREVMADREAQAAKAARRRKPVAKKPAPGRSAAHAAAAKRGDAARAKINKPLTKSQERRHAATKKAGK